MTFKQLFFLTAGQLLLVACNASSFDPVNVITNDSTITVQQPVNEDTTVIFHIVEANTTNLKLYWKDDKGENHANFLQLEAYLNDKGESLVFAMNGGMYDKSGGPVGLYIENGMVKKPINTRSGSNANFYLMPNGIFYLTEGGQGFVCKTEDFVLNDSIKYATQSGPMLLIDHNIHPAFNEGSSNLNIRNGVGILPDSNIVFAMSKDAINFYDFAKWFQEKGCQNALYLDGYVSRTYLPSQGLNGHEFMNFGVIIGETKRLK